MNNESMVFALRKKIFNEWRYKRYTWQEVRAKYGFSKRWFYKWLKRFLKDGEEGLRNKTQKRPPQPHSLAWDEEAKLQSYIYGNPTHGPDRIAREIDFKISGKTVWKFLKKKDLNTRRKRRLWAHHQGKPVLTSKEKNLLQAKKNHIESNKPGELVSMDTMMVCVNSVGKVWQYTACDTYSSFGWAKVYPGLNSDCSIDFFKNHILKNLPEGKILRILTDQGTEFYSARYREKLVNHCFTESLITHGIVHSVTKVAHPWTNGYVERLNGTIWEEFYLCRLKGPYASIEALNEDLQKFMIDYNFNRRHTGYKLKEGGYEFPGHAFFDIRERENTIEIKY